MNYNYIIPTLKTDGYKVGHKFMVPPGTEMMYSNMTPRSGKYGPKNIEGAVSAGQQILIHKIEEDWRVNFFSKPKFEVCGETQYELTLYLGLKTPFDVSHMEQLHDLGYLPLTVKSIPEGMVVPFGVPMFTFYNTIALEKGVFDWITNYLETIISTEGWKTPTAATIAVEFLKLGTKWAKKTDQHNVGFIKWQFHDFSMRGIDGISGVVNTSIGHAMAFYGSDSLPVIPTARKYYGAKGFVVGSVNASEHSVMSAGIGFQGEFNTYKRILTDFPEGIISLVSDTQNLWRVITEYYPELKDLIMARDGKLVTRGDSGNPVDIICGEELDHRLQTGSPREKGMIELLWDIFGGTVNDQGYKVLDPHVGAIYGDSINLERAEQIFERLEAKKFASTNTVLGIGSFTYQYVTRDTLGFAVKATEVIIDGKSIPIFKDPITDDGTKKSAKGLLRVNEIVEADSYGTLHHKSYQLQDQCTWEEEAGGALQVIFKDGEFYNQTTLEEIRARIDKLID